MKKPLILWTPQPASTLRPGTKVYAERVGTVRTVKAVQTLNGGRVVKVTFASKDVARFDATASIPVVR